MELGVESRDTPLPFPLDQEPESSLQIYREVFDLCDRDKNGYITKDELAHICHQVSDEEVAASVLDNVMVCLDSNHDGHITFEEFKAGFETFQKVQGDSATAAVSSSTPAKPGKEEVYESEPAPDGDEAAWREVADRIDPQGALAGTGVNEVWKELNQRDPALLESFEGFLSQVISELRQSDLERSTLQTHVKRILEQHSKEVNEMDHLLQEELQLAKATQQQTNESQTSRLSNHYSGLLAQREALIEELATQETDLKHALQEKTRKESELKEDRTLLLTANKALQDQLDTTLRSESGTTLGSAGESGQSTGGSGDEGTGETATTVPRAQTVGRAEGEEGEKEEEPRFIVTSPDSSLRLSVMQEAGDQNHGNVKYFPPKKYRVMSQGQDPMSADSDLPHTSQGHASLHKPLEPASSQSGAVSVTADSSPPVPTSSLGHKDQSPPFDDMVSTASLKNTAGLGLLGQPRSLLSNGLGHTPHSPPHSTVATPSSSTDVALGMSGVMPRRGQLPGPPTPTNHPLSRVFKVIFLGESGVGKSSLIGFLSSGMFPANVKSTVGLDYKVKTLRIQEETVVFQLWDTAGQERFSNALTPVYFRRADAFVIVYDVTDVRTFKATRKWVSVIKAALREELPVIMLVGNKSDRTSQRCVTVEDGRTLALELKALFSEMSAMSGDNVLQAHSTLAQLLLTRENADLQEIRKQTGTPSKSKCSC